MAPFHHPVDLSEQVIDLADAGVGESSAERIASAAEAAMDAFDLLFVHADGAGDPERARGALGVVPVRETEAWALVDGDALRQVLGSRKSDAELGVPDRADHVTDPKALLDQVVRAAHAHAKRRRVRGGASYLAPLGEEIRLERLRSLDAFRRLEDETVLELRRLGYLQA